MFKLKTRIIHSEEGYHIQYKTFPYFFWYIYTDTSGWVEKRYTYDTLEDAEKAIIDLEKQYIDYYTKPKKFKYTVIQ